MEKKSFRWNIGAAVLLTLSPIICIAHVCSCGEGVSIGILFLFSNFFCSCSLIADKNSEFQRDLMWLAILFGLVNVLVGIALLTLVLFYGISRLRKKKALHKYLWYLPAAMTTLIWVLGIGTLHKDIGPADGLFLAVEMMTDIAGYTMVGLWFKTVRPRLCPVRKRRKGKVVEILGGADKLRTYKELLDCGSITQEEFDEKKRQILGT